LRQLLRDKGLRDEEGVFAVEGDHLCGELCRAGCAVVCALVTERAMAKYPETAAALKARSPQVMLVSEEVAEYISDTKAAQGLFAIAEKPRFTLDFSSCRRLVMLDGVQDPGNVGTVIRTAEALGLDGVVLSRGCADVWSAKTLRASMGSALRLPCMCAELTEIIPQASREGFAVYGAMLDKSAQSLGGFCFPEKTAVVIGSEGSGVSAAAAALCQGSLYIPISGAESLNAAVAAAIIMWQMVAGE